MNRDIKMQAKTVEMVRLQGQIRTLQQQQRRMRIFAVMVAMLVGVVLITGQARSAPTDKVHKAVRAGRFVLVDRDGNERAVLGITPDSRAHLTIRDKDRTVAARVAVDGSGTPSLGIVNSDGKAYAELTLIDQLPRLTLADRPGGRARIGLRIWKSGDARLDVLDASGTMRSSIRASAHDESAGLTVYDRQQKARAGVHIAPDGAPLIALWDSKQRARLTVETAKDGSRPSISLFDANMETQRVSLSLEENNRPLLVFMDQQANMRVGLGLKKDGTALIELRDKDGKQSWTAP